MRRVFELLLFLGIALLGAPAGGQDSSRVDASLSQLIVPVRGTVQYQVQASVRGTTPIEFIAPPKFGKLGIIRKTQMPQIITINGVTERRLTLTWEIQAPDRPGKHTIGPPVLRFGKARRQPQEVTLEVVPASKAPRRTVQQEREKSSYFLEASLSPRRNPYVGEQVILNYDLFVDGGQMDVNPKPPNEPALDEFWIEDLSAQTSGRNNMTSQNGRLMQRTGLRTYALFPLRSGPATIAPMELELVVGGFFRSGRIVPLESEGIDLEVQPLPPNAPAEFWEGNVGQWDFRVTTDQSQTRVGRGVVVRVEASGLGLASRLQLPQLPEIPGARLSDVSEDTDRIVRNLRIGGTKVVRYTLTPLEEGTLEVPPLTFAYFDPETGKYVSQTSPAVKVNVARGVAPPEPVARDKMNRRQIAGGGDLVEDLLGRLNPGRAEVSLNARPASRRQPWVYWPLGALAAVAFVGALASPALARRRERHAPEQEKKRAADDALRDLEAAEGPGEIIAAVKLYLSDSFDVPRGKVTAAEIATALQPLRCDPDTTAKLEQVLAACEAARFGGGNDVDVAKLKDLARSALGSIRRARTKTRSGPAGLLSLLGAGALAAALSSLPADAGAAPLEDALAAEQSGDWTRAAETWEQLAGEHPDAVDVLHHLGTASARAHRWGAARLALERASLRAPDRDDIDSDLHIVARIVRLNSIEASRTGRTMEGDEHLYWWRLARSVNPHALGLLMVVAWLLAAGAVVTRRRTPNAATRDTAFVVAIVAVLIACNATFAYAARGHLVANTVALVVQTDELEMREGPSKLAKAQRVPSSIVSGTVLRAAEQRDEWVKLVWHGGAGWAKTAQLGRIE